MCQKRGLRQTAFDARTLAAWTAAFELGFVAAVRARLLGLESGPKLVREEREGLSQDVSVTQRGIVTISIPAHFSEFPLGLAFVITISETFLEPGCDAVRHALQFLVALGLCSLETACDVTAYEGHGDSI